MSTIQSTEGEPPSGNSPRPHIRRLRSTQLLPRKRSPLVNMTILIVFIGCIVFLVYQFMFDPKHQIEAEPFDLAQSAELISDLSTVKSHVRFGLVIREESGNIIVRSLAEQSEKIGMNSLSTMLFQNPTMIVELHGIATYGIKLDSFEQRIAQNDTLITVDLPPAEILDVKLVSGDTRIIATMKGLFRSSNEQLLLEASKKGERFVRQYAIQDSSAASLALERAKQLITTLVRQEGKHVHFR